MLVETALALEIHRTNPALPAATTELFAAWVVEEAALRGVDPWLFHGLVYTESRWTPGVVRLEDDHTCSVGLGQVNVPCDARRIAPLKDPRANLHRIGVFFDALRRRCSSDCGALGWLRGYNPGSRTYVTSVAKVISRCHDVYDEPPLRDLHPCVHIRGLPRQAACRASPERGLEAR